MTEREWLKISRAETPLILTMPHGGTNVPDDLVDDFTSPWAARRDADWHIASLYEGLVDATVIGTDISRSVIDCNRDPSGASLYPGMATTDLCPTTDFDGNALYNRDAEPAAAEVDRRREAWFLPYHEAIASEIVRLRALHRNVVVYDCHSIRSVIPRLFDRMLPELNIGTNDGSSCDHDLSQGIMSAVAASGRSHVLNGRFKGGWTTRHYGRPRDGIHAIQMEIAIRAYLPEPIGSVCEHDWPVAFDPRFAAPLRVDLSRILVAAMDFAKGSL